MSDTSEQSTSPAVNDERFEVYFHWGRRFAEQKDFDETERDYKLVIGERLVAARSALLEDDPAWLDLLRTAFGPPNNLTIWQFNDRFLKWCESNPRQAETVLRIIWDENRTVPGRFDDFVASLKQNGQKVFISDASFLHMAVSPTDYPIFRAMPVSQAYKLTDYPDPYGGSNANPGARYEHFLNFLDLFLKRAAERGLQLRDRLDAQSIIWQVTTKNLFPNDAPEEEREALEAYRSRDKDDESASFVATGNDPLQKSARKVPELSHAAILDAMHKFDLQDRDTDSWRDWESSDRHKWAIVHQQRRYPVEEILARATDISTHEILDAGVSNQYVQALGFTVEPLSGDQKPTVWWVAQGASYNEERDYGIILAPQKTKAGSTMAFWDNVTRVVPGDIVLHYANSNIRAVSEAISSYVESK